MSGNSDTREEPRILIVDDDDASRRLLSRILRAEGHHTHAVADGGAALEWLKEHAPDLILLDVMMPELDGYEVLRRIRRDPTKRSVPTMLVTGLSRTERKVEGFDCGADDFITKPIDVEELLARVRTQLRMKTLLDEVMAQRESLARKHAALRELERSRQELVDMLVRDLASPLAAVHTSVELLRQLGREAKEELGRTTLNSMAACSRQLGTIAQTLLDVKRLESEAHELERTEIAFAGLVEAAARPFAARAREDGIRLTIDLADGLEPGYADIDLLSRTFEHLIATALSRSRSGDEVIVRAGRDGDEFHFSVCDRGAPIDDELRASMFDTLEPRADGHSGQHALGLAFARMVVERHGGRIWIEEDDDGCRLCFALPAESGAGTTRSADAVCVGA